VIDSRPYISQSDVAKKRNLKRATITVNIKKLDKIGVIERSMDTSDHSAIKI